MDIYRLSEDIPEETKAFSKKNRRNVAEFFEASKKDEVFCGEDGKNITSGQFGVSKKDEVFCGEDKENVGSGRLTITDLRQGARNQDRVNIYINGKFSFSLDTAQVVDLGVRKGLVISSDRLLELKKASEFGKIYQRALEWMLLRPHSERELRDYLKRKVFEKKIDMEYIDKVVSKLRKKGYLNDERFAEWYVEYLTDKKNYSLKRIEMELKKKGISMEVIDELLEGSETYEAEKLEEIIAKKRAKYPDEQKLIAYLCRQGFDYQLVNQLVRSYEKD